MRWYAGFTLFLLGCLIGAFFLLCLVYGATGQADNIAKLYYALPGTIVGGLSILWNIYNQSTLAALTATNRDKDSALSLFTAHVAEPVRDAIKILEQLKLEIEKAAAIKDDMKRNAAMTEVVEEKVMRCIIGACSCCSEADNYMKREGHRSSFELKLHRISDTQKIDDVVVDNLCRAQQANALLDRSVDAVRKTLADKKAEMRTEIADAQRRVAATFDHKKKKPKKG